MQMMRNDTLERKFYAVWTAMFEQTMADLLSYYELAYQSSIMGEIIFDNQLAAIAKVISRDLFIKTYWQIFNEQRRNGTLDAHMYLLYAIFGGDATIYVQNPDPLHTIFHIATKQISLRQWGTRNGDNMVTRGGDNIVFRTVLQNLTNAEIAALLQATANYGEFLEFQISTNVDENDYGHVNELALWFEDFGSVTKKPDSFADYGFVDEPAGQE